VAAAEYAVCGGYTYGPVGEVRVFPNLGASRRRHRLKGAQLGSRGLRKLPWAAAPKAPRTVVHATLGAECLARLTGVPGPKHRSLHDQQGVNRQPS
jgi:hypothetical protein